MVAHQCWGCIPACLICLLYLMPRKLLFEQLYYGANHMDADMQHQSFPLHLLWTAGGHGPGATDLDSILGKQCCTAEPSNACKDHARDMLQGELLHQGAYASCSS